MAPRTLSRPGQALMLAMATALLAGCAAAPTSPASSQRREAVADLNQAIGQLASQAWACLDAPPVGWNAAGLAALAEHAGLWADHFTVEGVSAAPACVPQELALQTRRVATLGARLGATDSSDAAALVAMTRGLRVDLALGSDLMPPEVAGVLTAGPEVLSDLALAEDQAHFQLQYLAANTEPDPEEPDTDTAPLRQDLVALAALHAERAEVLGRALALADQADPRQAAYQINPTATVDAAAIQAEVARIEIALAYHYAALPFNTGAEDLVTWQLLQAHAWGASLNPFPFLQG